MKKSTTSVDSWFSWVVCLSAALFFFYEFIQMNMFNAITPELLQTFHVDAAQLGNLSAFYFYGDVIFLIPAGMILDRISTRTVILLAMIFCVSGTVIFANAHEFWVAGLGRLMTGVGNAFSFLSCIRLASRWFTPKHMALVVGVIVTIAMAGGAAAQTPLTILTQHVGWRHAMLYNAAFGAAIIVLVLAIVQDHPSELAAQLKQDQEELHQITLMQTLRLSLGNLQNWCAGMYASLLNLSIFIMGALFGALYLRQVDHLARTDASNITAMVFVGTIIGAPVWGYLSDKISLRKKPMIIGALLSIVTVFAIVYGGHLSYRALWSLFFLLGLFTSSQILAYPLISESNPSMITSTALGLSSVLIMAGGAIFQPLFGWMLDYHWSHLYRHHMPIYSPENFHFALVILPVAFVVALLAGFLLKETRCEPYKS